MKTKGNWQRSLTAILTCYVWMTLTCFGGSPHSGGPGGDTSSASYSIIELSPVSQGKSYIGAEAWALNERSEVVGQVEDPVTSELWAAYWSSDNKLSLLGGDGTSASGINDRSEIVGGNFETAFYWPSPTSQPTALPAFAGDRSQANDLNFDALICGSSKRNVFGPDPDNPENEILVRQESVAVVWKVTSDGILGPFALPSLFDLGLTNDPNEAFGVAADVSEANSDGIAMVTGTLLRSESKYLVEIAAINWEVSFAIGADGSMVPVITSRILDVNALSSGVNDSGQACGIAIGIPRTEDLPVFWNGSTVVTLAALANVSQPSPHAVNNAQTVVGTGWYQDRKTQGDRAVVWQSPGGGMILLDDFLGRRSSLIHLVSAAAINNQGKIVGTAIGGAYIAVP